MWEPRVASYPPSSPPEFINYLHNNNNQSKLNKFQTSSIDKSTDISIMYSNICRQNKYCKHEGKKFVQK